MTFIITIVFIGFDFLTGILKAFKNKDVNSSKMREGLFHKAGSIMLVIFGALVDYAQAYIDLGVKFPIAGAFCVYICIMEIGSIIENLAKINPELLPDKLKSYFVKLNDDKGEING